MFYILTAVQFSINYIPLPANNHMATIPAAFNEP